MYNFSENLNDLISDKGVSLRTIEKESGIPSSQLSRYLKATIPSLEIAVKLSNYFDCTLDYLFGLSDKLEFSSKKDYDITKFVPRYQTLLNENNTTHWKFAKKYNLSEALLRHWKYGEVPSLNSLIIIAENLGTNLEYLIGRSDEK